MKHEAVIKALFDDIWNMQRAHEHDMLEMQVKLAEAQKVPIPTNPRAPFISEVTNNNVGGGSAYNNVGGGEAYFRPMTSRVIHSSQSMSSQPVIPVHGPFNSTMHVPASNYSYNTNHMSHQNTSVYTNISYADEGSPVPDINITEWLDNYFDPLGEPCPDPLGPGAPKVDDRLRYFQDATTHSITLRPGQAIPIDRSKYHYKHDCPQNYETQLNMRTAINVLIKRGLHIGLSEPKVRSSPACLINPNPLISRCSFDKNTKSWIDSVNEFEAMAFEHGCSPRQVLIFMTNRNSYREGTKWNRIIDEQETSELWSHIHMIQDFDDLGNFCHWMRIREWFSRHRDFITWDYADSIKDKLNAMRVKSNPTMRSLSPLAFLGTYIHEATLLYKKLPAKDTLPRDKVRNTYAALKRGAEWQMQQDAVNGIEDRDCIDILVAAKVRETCELKGYDPDNDHAQIWNIMIDFADSQQTIHEAEVKRAKEVAVMSAEIIVKSVTQQSGQVAVASHQQRHHSRSYQQPKMGSPMMKYPQRANLLTIVMPQVSLKQHRDEAVSVRIAMKQYSSWNEIPMEIISLMHQEHEFRCSQEAIQMGTDETDSYYSMLKDEFLRNEEASRLRCVQAYSLTPNSYNESWLTRKWCRVCGLYNHIHINCSFRDFTTDHYLSTFKMKFQPDIIIDLILAACKSRGHLSYESGSTAIKLRERIMSERAEFLNIKEKALADGSFKQLYNNDKYNKYYKSPVSSALSATSDSKLSTVNSVTSDNKLSVVNSFAMNTVDAVSSFEDSLNALHQLLRCCS